MKLKRFLLPILILAVTITAMAFTLPRKSNYSTKNNSTESALVTYYFIYIGPATPSSFSEYTNPANYVLYTGEEFPYDLCESGDDAVCMISCEGAYYQGVFRPDFSFTGWGGAYWGLYNVFYYGYSGTAALIMKAL